MARDEARWSVVALARKHRRDTFDCGVETLNSFLRQYARQNTDRGVARTYVALRPGELIVRGYYSLAASAAAFEHLPAGARERLPRYPIPMVHLARLAVDQSEQGRGLGGHLLADAMTRVLEVAATIGVVAMDVTAKDARARSFYEHYGFESMLDDPLHMYLSIATIRALVGPS